MNMTIAICTWNRSRLLGQTLESLTKLTIPKGVNWEVVVVDNNSTDDTKQIVQNFSSDLPLLYVFEATQGHSVSRNTALSRASGDLIVWTDNDVVVPSHWLQSYAKAAASYPDAAFFGGTIAPEFESPKPLWLQETWEKCKAVYAARDLGEKDFQLSSGQFPYGANFAIRAEIQKEFSFDSTTGRKSGDLLGGDEISMLRQVTDAGHHGIWLGKAELAHIIPDDRATESYVAKYFVGQGRSNVQNGKAIHSSKWTARFSAKFHRMCYRMKRRSKKPDEWVSHMIRSSIAMGEYTEMS